MANRRCMLEHFVPSLLIAENVDTAQLALLTSQDEDDDFDKGGTDSSNDTDATLVDDTPTHSAFDRSPSPVQSPSSSVLGKRTRDVVCMDTDDSLTPEQGIAAHCMLRQILP
ncbi:hypothetical protein A0H81_13642 [Grifola frondosa]|uniref:Uncharacterized protein n=1 Tax=Grifola frondosa TaxID=5627 RepID=A0A1C7LQ93_GRIFR|nr:hypothetical protein A0H81_13642 [Grifola frondosa]